MEAVIYSFPFWMYIDKSNSFQTKTVNFGNGEIRVYPLYRNAPVNFSPIASIKISHIPFLKNYKWKSYPMLQNPILIPSFVKGDNGKNNLHLMTEDSKSNVFHPYYPMDSIRIDFFKDQSEHNERFNFIKKLLINLRCSSKQWWIDRSIETLTGGHLGVSFSINENGLPLEPPSALVNVPIEFIGFEKPIDKITWEKAIYDTTKNKVPFVWEEIYLDAAYFHACQDYKLCIISLSTSLEQAKDETFIRLWESHYPDQKYSRDRVQGNWDLTKHLDSKLKNNFNFSYKDEYPEHWQTIKKLWDVRGNVAHGNVCTYEDSIIDGIESKKFFEPVQHCIDWLINLNR